MQMANATLRYYMTVVNCRLDLLSLDILELLKQIRQWLSAALGGFQMLPYMDRQIFVHSVAEA
jgi:hypothetical protein